MRKKGEEGRPSIKQNVGFPFSLMLFASHLLGLPKYVHVWKDPQVYLNLAGDLECGS